MDFAFASMEEDEVIVFTAEGPVVVEKPKPEVPPPCWDERPIDGARAMQEIRVLCGGHRRD